MTGKTEIRFTVPLATYMAWKARAAAYGLRVSTWLPLAVDGLLSGSTAALPVQTDTQPLRERLLAAIGTGGLKKDAVPALARRLGVSARSVHASLGSMVASKRLARAGDEYRKV